MDDFSGVGVQAPYFKSTSFGKQAAPHLGAGGKIDLGRWLRRATFLLLFLNVKHIINLLRELWTDTRHA